MVVTPEVGGRLLFEALAEARLSRLPEDREELRAFAKNELSQLVAERIGDDAAHMMLERIELVLRALDRIAHERARVPGERRREDATLPFQTEGKRAERSTEPPSSPAISAQSAARVVLVSGDARLGSGLRVRVGALATVLTYRTLDELARSPIGVVHALVLDVRELGGPFELSLSPATVVLWPADLALRDEVAARHPHLDDVRFAGADAGIDDLATVIRVAVEPR